MGIPLAGVTLEPIVNVVQRTAARGGGGGGAAGLNHGGATLCDLRDEG